MAVRRTVPEGRVLVVEDDHTLRTVIAQALAEDGFAVEMAADGEAALDLMRRAAPDLVILDLMLPFMGGEEFATTMRGIAGLELTPVIIISASRFLEQVGARVGAKLALRKPFDLFELTEQVTLLLRK
jgi:DNA-binding response OmpR family regulator